MVFVDMMEVVIVILDIVVVIVPYFNIQKIPIVDIIVQDMELATYLTLKPMSDIGNVIVNLAGSAIIVVFQYVSPNVIGMDVVSLMKHVPVFQVFTVEIVSLTVAVMDMTHVLSTIHAFVILDLDGMKALDHVTSTAPAHQDSA